MFNEKSCGNCIKSWSKCFMWICAVLICLRGIIAVYQVITTTQEEIQILQTECKDAKSQVSYTQGKIVKNEYNSKIQTVKNASIRPIMLILIEVIGAIFVNRFFWGMCFGFGIITHYNSERNTKECGLKKESQNPEFDENLLKYTK